MQIVDEPKRKKRKHKALERTPREYLPPICPVHFVSMYAGSSQRLTTYYYCRVEGCGCSRKVAR